MSVIPALERGLRLLDLLIRESRGLSYGELKKSMADVGDASLARLLKSLVETTHVEKVDDGSYGIGLAIKDWFSESEQGSRQRDDRFIDLAVKQLSETLQESVGYVEWDRQELLIESRCIQVDSLHVMDIGTRFKLQSDHAAALAIFSTLSSPIQEDLMDRSLTEFLNWESYLKDEQAFRYETAYLDQSRLRRGVSRMAMPVVWERGRGALFICSTTEQLEQKKVSCYMALKKTVAQLLKKF